MKSDPRARKFTALPKDRFNEAGEKVCCWCGGQLASRRQRWCSQKCVDEYLERSSQAGVRKAVWKRDRGVCSVCGLDTARIERIVERLRGLAYTPLRAWREDVEITIAGVKGRDWEWRQELHPAAARRAEQLGIALALLDLWAGSSITDNCGRYRSGLNRTLWEADHIVPLVEGGDPGPENCQTLCCRCHKDKTAAGATARAKRRRRQMELGV